MRFVPCVLTGVLVIMSTGCATTVTMQPHRAQSSTVVMDSTDIAYEKIQGAVLKMGGMISSLDPQRRMVAARLNKAVTLHVALTPQSHDTKLDIYVTAESGWVLARDVDAEMHAFLVAYQKEQG